MMDVEHYLCKAQINDLPLPYTASSNWVYEFLDIFSEKGFEQLSSHYPWDHVIEFTTDFKPVNSPIYPLTLKKQEALDQFLQENLDSRWIYYSKSLLVLAIFFVKKDGTLRLVIDY